MSLYRKELIEKKAPILKSKYSHRPSTSTYTFVIEWRIHTTNVVWQNRRAILFFIEVYM